MKRSLYLFFLLVTVLGWGQTGVIKGIVIDKQSEQVLPGATIELLDQVETKIRMAPESDLN